MKTKLTCYIIDDEPLAQEILEAYIAKVTMLDLKGSFMSPLEAAVSLEEDKPDVLFLDINMPDLDGLSFIETLNYKPMIVFTTAYDQYALKAFEQEARDYLLKPFSFERFYKCVTRLHQEKIRAMPQQQPQALEIEKESKREHQHIFVKVGHRIRKLACQDILYVEGVKDYLRICTLNEKILTLMNFAKLELLLPSPEFARVHRSFLVAIDKIDYIEKNRIRIADEFIPVSETYAASFHKLLDGRH